MKFNIFFIILLERMDNVRVEGDRQMWSGKESEREREKQRVVFFLGCGQNIVDIFTGITSVCKKRLYVPEP